MANVATGLYAKAIGNSALAYLQGQQAFSPGRVKDFSDTFIEGSINSSDLVMFAKIASGNANTYKELFLDEAGTLRLTIPDYTSAFLEINGLVNVSNGAVGDTFRHIGIMVNNNGAALAQQTLSPDTSITLVESASSVTGWNVGAVDADFNGVRDETYHIKISVDDVLKAVRIYVKHPSSLVAVALARIKMLSIYWGATGAGSSGA